MRVVYPTGTRSTPLDRNPSTVASGTFLNQGAGGSNLNLVNYTVPANRRADVVIQWSSLIGVALGAATTANITANFTPNGGAAQNLYESLFLVNQALGSRDNSPSIHLQMKAGDNITITLHIDAGAGAIQNAGGIQGVEYDA